MTNAPKTDLDPASVRLRTGPGDWTDWGRRIRQAAARTALIDLLEHHDVGVVGGEDTDDAIRPESPIHPDGPVDVVGGDAESQESAGSVDPAARVSARWRARSPSATSSSVSKSPASERPWGSSSRPRRSGRRLRWLCRTIIHMP